ncbi:MAG: hypothetical protein ACRDGM_05335 [bacterium]
MNLRKTWLRHGCLAVLLNSVAGLFGCATGTYTPPQAAVQPPQYERVVNRSFDDTWSSLIDYTSQAFFGIDRFEKASGLMTLSFGSPEPERFIDCGHMKAQAAAQSIDMPYARYVNERFGATLNGKMNIVVRSLDPKRTLVRVNARYIFIVPPQTQPQTPAQTWTFDSGGEATIRVAVATSGTIPTRTCRPTYAAERAILDAVSK